MQSTNQMKSIALVCASNQNRSMECHSLLLKKGYQNLSSYGTNTRVKLPGPSIDQPLIYDFGTPYSVIADDLRQKDLELYTQRGLIRMLERNMAVKLAPERFQDNTKQFDVIFAFEERVFDILVEYFNDRPSVEDKPVFVLGVNVVDTPESAVYGAEDIYNFLQLLETTEDQWIDNLDDVISEFQVTYGKEVFFSDANRKRREAQMQALRDQQDVESKTLREAAPAASPSCISVFMEGAKMGGLLGITIGVSTGLFQKLPMVHTLRITLVTSAMFCCLLGAGSVMRTGC